MNPGDVRVFQQGTGNALVVGLGIWATRQNDWIHIHLTGPNQSHTTVTNNPDSVRYHRTLFRNLRQTLIAQSCWPFAEDGSETEEEAPLAFEPVPIHGKPLSATIIEDRGGR